MALGLQEVAPKRFDDIEIPTSENEAAVKNWLAIR